jgi:MYXO-CTERM domain-containing protein
VSRPTRSAFPGVLAALVACLLVLAVPAAAQEPPALLRVVHFGLGAPTVDVWIDGAKAHAGLAFKGASRYLELPAGTHRVVLRPAGGSATTKAVTIASARLRAGAPATLALLGKPGAFEAAQVADDFTLPPKGQTRIRLLNANPDSPGVDVATPGGVVLVRDVRYKEASPYVAVPAGRPFAANILAAGTDTLLVSTEGTEPLPAGAVITVVGARTPKGVETLSILDAAGSGSLPRGGIATGGGGTATGGGPAAWPLVAALALLAVAAAGRRARSRPGGRRA